MKLVLSLWPLKAKSPLTIYTGINTWTFCFLAICLLLIISCAAQKEPPKVGGGEGCFCTADYEPVCGEDGRTYSNACMAECARIKNVPGECAKQTP